MNSCIHSMYYHNPSVKGFERMVSYYTNKGYRFVSLEELRGVILKKDKVNEKLAFVSFDDGWKSNIDIIPVCEKYNVPITIFVATEPVESGNFWWEYLLKDRGKKRMFEFKNLPYKDFYFELAKIKKKYSINRSAVTMEELMKLISHPLVTIQSHTVNHPILTNVPDEVLDAELSDSQKKLSEVCGYDIFSFSYPNGSLSEREVDAVGKYYDLAFTTEQRHIKIGDNPLLLPRVALTGDYYKDLLKVWGIWPYFKKIITMIKGY